MTLEMGQNEEISHKTKTKKAAGEGRSLRNIFVKDERKLAATDYPNRRAVV